MARKSLKFIFTVLCCLTFGCSEVNPRLAAGIRQGEQNYQRGNLIGAEQALTGAISADPNSPAAGEAYYIRGLVRLKDNRTRSAEADFSKALKLTPRDDLKMNCRICLGSIAYGRNDDDRAYRHYRRVVDRLPMVSPNERVLYRLGALAQRQGKWREGKRYFAKVIRDFPKSETARLARKRIYYDHFTIQAGAFSRKNGALTRVRQLRQAGLPVRSEVKTRGTGTLMVVYVGNYKDLKSASNSLDKVKRIVPDARIVP